MYVRSVVPKIGRTIGSGSRRSGKRRPVGINNSPVCAYGPCQTRTRIVRPSFSSSSVRAHRCTIRMGERTMASIYIYMYTYIGDFIAGVEWRLTDVWYAATSRDGGGAVPEGAGGAGGRGAVLSFSFARSVHPFFFLPARLLLSAALSNGRCNIQRLLAESPVREEGGGSVGVAGGQFPLSLAKKKRERGGGVKKNRKREPRGPRSLRPSNWRRCPSTEQKETELSLSLSFFRSVSFFARFSIARNLLIPFFVFFWKTVCVEIDSRCSWREKRLDVSSSLFKNVLLPWKLCILRIHNRIEYSYGCSIQLLLRFRLYKASEIRANFAKISFYRGRNRPINSRLFLGLTGEHFYAEWKERRRSRREKIKRRISEERVSPSKGRGVTSEMV